MTTKTNQSKSCFSKWQFQLPGTKPGRVSVPALVLLLSATVTLTEAGEHKVTFVPQLANIAGVKIGYSSMAELEKHLGKGRVTIGGHPNGAKT